MTRFVLPDGKTLKMAHQVTVEKVIQRSHFCHHASAFKFRVAAKLLSGFNVKNGT
eukprot:UN04639